MSEENDKKPAGLEFRDQQIANIPNIDCSLIDARTRKVLLYLVNQEIKKLEHMPEKWGKEALDEMEGIKAGLEMCKQIRMKTEASEDEEKKEGIVYKI